MALHAHRPRLARPTTRSRRATSPTSTPPASRPPSSHPATSSRPTAPASASATIDGSTALVADGGITGPLRAASEASTDTEWREATGELLAELALDAGASRTTVLATFDRGATSQTARVSAAHRRDRRIRLVLARGPLRGDRRTARVADAARRARDRRAAHRGRAHGRDARPTSPSSRRCSPIERLLTGPTRRELLSLLDVAWLDDRDAWTSAVVRLAPQAARRARQRLGRAEQHHQRGLDRDRRAHDDRERPALSRDRGGRRVPVERSPHRRGAGGADRRAAIAVHRTRAGRRGRRQRRGDPRGVADLAHRGTGRHSGRDPRQRAGRLGGPRSRDPRRDRGPRVRHRRLAQHPPSAARGGRRAPRTPRQAARPSRSRSRGRSRRDRCPGSRRGCPRADGAPATDGDAPTEPARD